jgi:hypothetical protein
MLRLVKQNLFGSQRTQDILFAILVCMCTGEVRLRAQPAEPPDFAQQVRPILSEHCFHCHGPDAATREADLRLDQAESASRVLTSPAGETSQLWQRITTTDPDHRMPPADSAKQLDARELEILTSWLSTGGDYEVHWAFAPPARPRLPSTVQDPWCNNPIDSFVLEGLQPLDWQPAQPAPPETLLRRASYDLSGFPPTPTERSEFLRQVEVDGLEVAYQALIDRLLSNPRYAEHMTLPWLEASRYADTDGYQNDRYRYQHAWRDWVIRAYSHNMPYDEFVVEQIAGDMLPQASLWQQVATGFGRNHRINSEDGSIPDEWLTENIADRVDTLGTVFLGLTVGCARCHDHKYDPISQRDYYQLYAHFNNIAEHGVGPNNGNSPPFVDLPASWPLLSSDEDRARVPEPVKLRQAREDSGNGLSRPQAGAPTTVMVMHELSQPRPTYVLLRGQYNTPDTTQPVEPGVPQALAPAATQSAPPRNRLELARWLVHPQHPLTARVAINRMWQQFFGTGIVESSENFGSQGTPPSHPELLDWLAVEFIASGWDVRHIQRLILLSSTYRQSSQVTPDRLQQDPENRRLARGPRLRLPAFTLRDQALALSGLLVEKTGGVSVKPYMPADIWSSISNNKYEQDSGESLFRRSLYTYWRRTIPPPTMMNFNAAAREVCTVRTETTNTPLQALTLMNNVTFVEAAKKLAERVLSETASTTTIHSPSLLAQRINDCCVACLSRLPSATEAEILLKAYSAFEEQFQADPTAAKELLTTGEAPFDTQLAPVPLAALTMTVSLIMNLDEAISKE